MSLDDRRIRAHIAEELPRPGPVRGGRTRGRWIVSRARQAPRDHSGRGRLGDRLAEGVDQLAGEVREPGSAFHEPATPIQGARAHRDEEVDLQVEGCGLLIPLEKGDEILQGVLQHHGQGVGLYVAGRIGGLLTRFVGDVDGACGRVCADEYPPKLL